MGIPPDTVYNNNCPACFPVGESPRDLWATFTGVKKGPPPAAPGLPLHADGTVRLATIGPCKWSGLMGPFHVTLTMGVHGTRLESVHPPNFWAFWAELQPICLWTLLNEQPGMPVTFYSGGIGQITWI